MVDTTPSAVLVPVKSAWSSKINWTQAAAAATAIITAFGIDIPDQAKANVLLLLTVAQGTITWIQRTWFTTTITAASVEK